MSQQIADKKKPNNFEYLHEKIKTDRIILLQGGTRCFPSFTYISTPKGRICISKINIGDLVNTPYGVKKVVNKFMYNGEQNPNKLITFVLNNGKYVTSTNTHEFRVKGEFIEANVIAKRAMEKCEWIEWEIYGQQHGQVGEYVEKVKELIERGGGNYEAIVMRKRISKDSICDKWQTENSKSSQDSCGTLVRKSIKKATGQSHKQQSIRQPSGKFGVGYTQRKCSSHGKAEQAICEQWGKEWNVENDLGYCKSYTTGIQAENSYDERFSCKIQRNKISNKGLTEWEDLELCEIEIDEITDIIYGEYTGCVYDFEVEQAHCYYANGFLVHNSGKTFATIYFIIDYCMLYSGMEIDIVRDTFTALKATAWKDFKDVLMACNMYDERNHNKTDHQYILNGNTISYYGADTPDKIHGRSRDILWVNEAHQFPAETIDQLFPRTRHKIICDYNPALGLEHWLDQYIEKYPPLITTYKDNPYLTAAQVEDIESRKHNDYWWKIYGSGERATREGAIFTNWSVGDFDMSLPYCYGQDYGFSIDPTTLIKVAVNEKTKTIFADELLYSNQSMGTESILTANKELINKPNDLIIADNAEPRLIDDLKRKGLNILPCEKGQGSVTAGITKMQDYKIVITERSHNFRKELSNYVWNDKRAGIPIDAFNHGIDALRYAFTYLTRPKYSTVIKKSSLI